MININFSLTYIEIYLITINIFAFLLYGFDKLQAIRSSKKIRRVSELRLLISSFIGGSIGALVSMLLFRHKIKKFSFMWKFISIQLIQAVAIYYSLYY
jgi:uncharacterized membrane protein YsdA (DUF1294 family)